MQIVVIGGGIGGLTAAIALRRAGFDAHVYEQLHELREIGAGEHGGAPASIVALSGDVHHSYLANVAYPRSADVRSAVYQAVCSPVRNPLASTSAAWRTG